MFFIGADVTKNKLELTVEEIKKELESLINHSLKEEELTVAKNHLLGSLQLEVANPFSFLDKIKNIRLNQLSEDYYKNLFASVYSENSENLKATAKKYFSPDGFFEVSVG